MAVTYPFTGILVRASLDDTGMLPRSAPLRASPDTSPQGTQPLADPVTYLTSTYDQDVAKPVVADMPNYVYIRGKNLSDIDQAGVAYIYWAKASDLDYPSRWKNNHLLTSSGGNSINLPVAAAGEIVVGDTPFLWTPTAPMAGEQYALIGVIATNDHPNPVPTLRDFNFHFDTWVSKQGGVGTLETGIAPPPKPSATVSTTGLYNLTGYAAGEFYFYIRTVGIPVGSKVSFKAVQPDSGGGTIELPWSEVNTDPFKTGTSASLDADWSSLVTFNLSLAKDALPLATNSVTLYIGRYEETLGKAKKDEMRVYDDSASGPSKFVILAQYTTTINVPVQPV